MTVLSVTALTVKPDRYEDFLATTKRSKSILEWCGAKNVRLIVATGAGEASGRFALAHEADDFAASGAIKDKFFTHPEGLEIMMESNSTSGPTATWQTSTWVEFDL